MLLWEGFPTPLEKHGSAGQGIRMLFLLKSIWNLCLLSMMQCVRKTL